MAAASSQVVAADESLTIENVMSAPFPYGLTASPKGEKVAWIANHHGARNIWLAEANGKSAARAITHWQGDNGIELADLQWSRDGSTLVFARGGSLEGGGPVNPVSSLCRSHRDGSRIGAARFWRYSLLRAGLGGVVSPVSDEVVFVRDGQIWMGDLEQSPTPATQLVQDAGAASELSWSPDGKRARVRQQPQRLFSRRRLRFRRAQYSVDESGRRS